MVLNVSNNKFTFEDLEYNMDLIPPVDFIYSPQDSIGAIETFTKNSGENFSYTLSTGGTQNIYKWYKDGVALDLQTDSILVIDNLKAADAGKYYCKVTNTLVPGLTLNSREITVWINECIKIKFSDGWNIFSSPVLPEETDMKGIFQPFIDNESLVKIQDESGNSLEDYGIYGGWKNNIGDISITEGYKVKMSLEDSIVICGSTVEYPFAIPLKTGWNIISYPQTIAIDGLDVVQELIDRGVLIKVQNESGQSIEDYGIYGGWTTNIGNFLTGEGYKIKVSADDTLWIYSSYPKSNVIETKLIQTTHYQPVFKGNGIDHMNINLVNLAESGILEGDEIGIFDGDLCVGSAKVTGQNSSFISLIASANDENSELANGFINDNEIILKLYRNGKEYPMSLQFVNSVSGEFEKNGTIFALANMDINTGIELPGNEFGANIYPNPFNDILSMNINLPKQEELIVEIYDMYSRKIKQLYQGTVVGTITLQWDGNDAAGNKVADGVYFCRVNKIWKKVMLSGK
jgi:hypothetical protein